MRRAAAKQRGGGPTRSRGASFVTLVGLFLSATGLATIAMLVLTGTTLAQTKGDTAQDIPRLLGSLKTATVPTPPNLTDFVVDKPTAIALGKAFFWDMQMGGDGVQACATCHFQAGADVRTKNTISPGVLGGDVNWQGKGPNYSLTFADYPLHHLIDSDDNQSFVLSDKDDITGSQGVFDRNFNLPGTPAPLTKAVDSCTAANDGVFTVGGLSTRRVTGRNAPSVIDAAFNFRNFWDGRANNNFNGVNPFGDRDQNAVIFKNVVGYTTPQPVHVSIPFSSLASQAVGPPGSGFEMSCGGRIFPNMGRKMLTAVPLGKQLVDTTDSVLGPYSNQTKKAGTNGLNTTYIAMIQKAFNPNLWQSTSLITIGNSSPVSLSELSSDLYSLISGGQIVADNSAYQQKNNIWIPTNQYTQIEANFSLFWGLAIQLYEDSLIANDSPVDKFFDGNKAALTPEQLDGMAIFENQGKCINCHGGPETTNASIAKVTSARLERMHMGDHGVAVYDDGFYNIGVRPTTEDPGVGGTDPFGNPLSETKLCQQSLAAGGTCDPSILNILGRTSENLPAWQLQATDRTAVAGNFMVPGLRNVELTGPYFHNGGQATLREVVDFYSRGGDFPDQNIHDLDTDIGFIGLSEEEKNDLVSFLIGLTDERVRWEKAPFDHPSLCVPGGHPGTTTSVTPDPANPTQATDSMICLPAIGAAGRSATQGPVVPFLANPADPNVSKFQYQTAPLYSGDVKAGADSAAIDPKGTTAALFAPPSAPGVAPAATLFSWGNTSPSGMTVVDTGLKNADGSPVTELWVGDHVMGLCRLDAAPDTLKTVNADSCDPNGIVGSPGQPVYDAINVNPDGSHYMYVPDNSRKSNGVWRLSYHPPVQATDPTTGLPAFDANGKAVLQSRSYLDNAYPMDSALAGIKADALALGPDMFGVPNGALYVGSLQDAGIRRVNNILDPNARDQWIDVIAQTTDGRGINGSMAFLPVPQFNPDGTRALDLNGNPAFSWDLYLPENRGLTVIRNAPGCFAFQCFPETVNIPGLIFANSVATDGVDKVYLTTNVGAPGVGRRAGAATTQAQILRYSVSTGNTVVFETQGMNPPAGSVAADEDCSESLNTAGSVVTLCRRPADAWTVPGQPTSLFFVLGLYYDQPSGTLYIADDPMAGKRFGSGHVWVVNAAQVP